MLITTDNEGQYSLDHLFTSAYFIKTIQSKITSFKLSVSLVSTKLEAQF